MSPTVPRAVDIRPFHVDASDEALEDVRRRITAAQRPEEEDAPFAVRDRPKKEHRRCRSPSQI
jgi:hypothetical protein